MTLLIWIMNYLTERRQFVQFDDIMSDTLTISTGDPQGSILGALLFALYITNIHLASNKLKTILYADDTTLVGHLCSFKCNTNSNMQDYNTIIDNINTKLNYISERLYVNKLSLNTSKTKYMFHFPQRSISDINGTNRPIQCVRYK